MQKRVMGLFLALAVLPFGAGSAKSQQLAQIQAGGRCPAEAPNPYCGGGQLGPAGELSCSPFQYRPWTYNNENGPPNWCNDPKVSTLAGGAFDTTRAWMHFKDSQGTQDSSYWVFHGCDGAGIMPDCRGDVKFVERIYEPSPDQSTVHCQGDITLDQVPARRNDPGSARRQCNFKHPGTGTIYSNYEAGNWSWGESRVPNWMVASGASGGWGQNVGQIVAGVPNPFGQPAIVMVTYPWVCTGVGSGDNQKGLFSNPVTPGAKCYWDNEPLTDGRGGRGYPPQIQLYWMRLDKDGNKDRLTVQGYYLSSAGGPQMVPMNGGSAWTLYPCERGECPW